jgi:NTE family protein
MRKLLILFFIIPLYLHAQDHRPSIGVALSGGGAKGLAHIGILKAIDSAGLKVDYITGTSMGSVVGSLYAIGYPADSIERMARGLDWDVLLSNRTSLRALTMEEKDEYGKYAVELPWTRSGFKLPTGVLEGQELWLKLSEMLWPVWNVKDFNCFSVPFSCVGTHVATAEGIVIDRGELLTAVRASMAIPTVFTAVEVDGKRLVDGGLVRNFPVQDVRAMGADFVIGSSVSGGLMPQEKLTDATQILSQIVFFQEGLTLPEEIRKCDIYVQHPVDAYSPGSFNKADAVIDLGIEQGRLLYPRLKRMADSLNALYGAPDPAGDRLPRVDSVFIASSEVRGLERTTAAFFRQMMGFEDGTWYTPGRLSERIRKVFGTRYYQRIIYALHPQADGTAHIVFDVVENPLKAAKLGVHYNQFSSVAVLTTLTARNFLLPYSRTGLTLNISENFRLRAEHVQLFGKSRQYALIPSLEWQTLGFPTYAQFRPDGQFRQMNFRRDLRVQHSRQRSYTIGTGLRFETIGYRPSIESELDVRGQLRQWTGFGFFTVNTLDRNGLPTQGIRLDAELGYIFGQQPSLVYRQQGELVGAEALGISFRNAPRVQINWESYLPVNARQTLLTTVQAGARFYGYQPFFNEFVVGGQNRLFRNQVVFSGLDEGSLYTSSVAALQLGWRYRIFNKLYATLRANALGYDFVTPENTFRAPRYLTGYGFSLAYDSVLGPLEMSVMYCDQAKQFNTYINLGIAF